MPPKMTQDKKKCSKWGNQVVSFLETVVVSSIIMTANPLCSNQFSMSHWHNFFFPHAHWKKKKVEFHDKDKVKCSCNTSGCSRGKQTVYFFLKNALDDFVQGWEGQEGKEQREWRDSAAVLVNTSKECSLKEQFSQKNWKLSTWLTTKALAAFSNPDKTNKHTHKTPTTNISAHQRFLLNWHWVEILPFCETPEQLYGFESIATASVDTAVSSKQ